MRRARGDEHVLAVKRAVLGFFGEVRLALERIEHRRAVDWFGRDLVGADLMIDGLAVGRWRGAGLAFRGQDGAAREVGLKVRSDFRGQLGREVRLVVSDFLLLDPPRRAARDDGGKQARETALPGLRGLGRLLRLFRLERLDMRGDVACARLPRVEPEDVGNLEPDHFRLGQAARAELAASHLALVGLHHVDAGLPEPGDVPLRGRVLPHPHVHCRNREHRLVGREDKRGAEIIGDARGHLGEQVRGGRADDDQVGLAAELDVPDLGLVLQVPQRGMDLVLGERREAHRRDELRPAVGQHASDLAAALADQPNELARLVGGNTAAHDEQDTRRDHLAVQFPPAQCAGSRA